MEKDSFILMCLLLFFTALTSGCDSRSAKDSVSFSPKIVTTDLRSRISEKPLLSIRRYPLLGFQLDRAARSKLLFSLVDFGLVKASPGVCIHMIRLRRFRPINVDKQLEFDRACMKFEDVLFNDEAYRKSNGGVSILVDTPFGVRYRITPLPRAKNYELASQLGAVAHRDQVLAKLFESGRSLTFPVTTPNSRSLVGADILIDSLASFDMRSELEWTLMAYCGYLKASEFVNSAGVQFSLIELAERVFQQHEGSGSCHGCHRLYALAVFLSWAKIEVEKSGETENLRNLTKEIRQHFKQISIRLEKNQSKEGFWSETWWMANADSNRLVGENELSNRIRATGHLLEWCAITPPDLRPNDEVIAKGVGYLSGLLLPRPDFFAEKHLLETSHALSALFLLDSLEIANEQ